MARVTKQDIARAQQGRQQEHVEVLSAGPIQEHRLEPIRVQPNVIVGDATGAVHDEEELAADPKPATQVKYAIVTRGGFFQAPSGTRAKVPTGKEVDSLNYDFGALQRANIGLKLIREDQRGQYIDLGAQPSQIEEHLQGGT